MLKKAIVLGGSNAVTALFGLGRNIIIARLISVDDFGIASTFAITMTLVEMSSDLALNRFIVQDRKGGTPRLQKTIQAIHFLRGVIAGFILFVLAKPISDLFGVPEAKWCYELMAIVPMLRGAINFDMYRFQRQMRFGPTIFVELSAASMGIIAAFLLAVQFQDYRSMLFSILLQQIVFFAASHFVAKRSYRWSWERQSLQRMGSFGWPLLLNGLLMFLIFQGDRIIVGNVLGMSELAWFSAALTLAMSPTLVLASTLRSYTLPRLSAVKENKEKFFRLFSVTFSVSLMLASSIVIFFFVAGPFLISLLYGAKYAPAASIVVWLGILQAFRLARTGPSVVAISRAKTTNPLYTNVLRALFLVPAWFAALQGANVTAIIAIGIAGEAAALMLSLVLLNQTLLIPVRRMVLPLALTVIIVMFVVFDKLMIGPVVESSLNLNLFALLVLIIYAVQFFLTVRSALKSEVRVP